MTRGALEAWLRSYGRAWETHDPEAVARLFTQDASYQETPFVRPLRGRAAIREYWSRVTGAHKNVRFEFEVLSVTRASAIARWRARFFRDPPGAQFRLDGIFVLSMTARGLCRELREWWVKKQD